MLDSPHISPPIIKLKFVNPLGVSLLFTDPTWSSWIIEAMILENIITSMRWGGHVGERWVPLQASVPSKD